MNISDLIRRYGLVSDQVDVAELAVVLSELEKALAVQGAVVEFGCYTGTTSLYIRRLLDNYQDAREFHVYDSFEGLPEKSNVDESPAGTQFKAGELMVSKKQFIREFDKAHLRLPTIHKAWFNDLTPADVPTPIAFAFLDGDYYESIMTSLRLIEGKLVPGAVVVVDDYVSDALPGAAKAVDEWCAQRGLTPRVMNSLALIHV